MRFFDAAVAVSELKTPDKIPPGIPRGTTPPFPATPANTEFIRIVRGNYSVVGGVSAEEAFASWSRARYLLPGADSGARHTAHRSMGHTAERLRCAPGVQSRACARFPPLSHTNNPSIINLQIKKKAQIAPPPTYADLMMIYAGARPPEPPPRTPSAWLRASRIPAEFMQGMQPRWAESRDSGDN
ncbi:hypothetical protein GEV33_013901 [Tenebrio molitor]|uniref:Uncharacterized protein n=1 Tax=Tenebrio molitor TaxID=7067 RepID=A0A8J6H702_TENMO|nr:hypothetical protein GEV33_013901 [Tenebrio molitor]